MSLWAAAAAAAVAAEEEKQQLTINTTLLWHVKKHYNIILKMKNVSESISIWKCIRLSVRNFQSLVQLIQLQFGGFSSYQKYIKSHVLKIMLELIDE